MPVTFRETCFTSILWPIRGVSGVNRCNMVYLGVRGGSRGNLHGGTLNCPAVRSTQSKAPVVTGEAVARQRFGRIFTLF